MKLHEVKEHMLPRVQLLVNGQPFAGQLFDHEEGNRLYDLFSLHNRIYGAGVRLELHQIVSDQWHQELCKALALLPDAVQAILRDCDGEQLRQTLARFSTNKGDKS